MDRPGSAARQIIFEVIHHLRISSSVFITCLLNVILLSRTGADLCDIL